MHDISQSNLLFKLKEKLVNLGLAETDIENVINTLKCEDLFRKCNIQTLKTDQKRKTVFKTSFYYVEPKPIYLGRNETGKECFAQYTVYHHRECCKYLQYMPPLPIFYPTIGQTLTTCNWCYYVNNYFGQDLVFGSL